MSDSTHNATAGAQTLADEHGLDLATVTGTGDDGRILKPDVEAAIDAAIQAANSQPDVAPEDTVPVEMDVQADTQPAAPTRIVSDELTAAVIDSGVAPLDEQDVAVERRGGPQVMEQADTQVSRVLRTVTNAATVGPKTDLLITTRLDVEDSPIEVDQDALASGDVVEVFSPNKGFAGVRAGVAFAAGRGLATSEQAGRLVREFGCRCPALG